jgi:hypothetical protein
MQRCVASDGNYFEGHDISVQFNFVLVLKFVSLFPTPRLATPEGFLLTKWSLQRKNSDLTEFQGSV